MTTQQIKDLIAQTIAGQGNQVDSGGKLAEILNAIVDAVEQGGGSEPLVIPSSEFLNEGVIETEATYNSILEAVRNNRRVVLHHPSGNVSTVVGTNEDVVLYAGESTGAGVFSLLLD